MECPRLFRLLAILRSVYGAAAPDAPAVRGTGGASSRENEVRARMRELASFVGDTLKIKGLFWLPERNPLHNGKRRMRRAIQNALLTGEGGCKGGELLVSFALQRCR